MSLNTRKLRAESPLAKPTPSTAPTMQWVVEMGRPNFEAIRMVIAAPNSALNPRVGVSSVILRPIVSITRHPQVARPITIPTPPIARSHVGTVEVNERPPFLMMSSAAATGPMAFATSLAP